MSFLNNSTDTPEFSLQDLGFGGEEDIQIGQLDSEFVEDPGLDSLDLAQQIADFDLSDPEEPSEDLLDSPICTQVEETFLGLISRGQTQKILELTNLDLPSTIEREVREQFCSLYIKAVSELPALALYQRTLQNGIRIRYEEENGVPEFEFEFPQNLTILAYTDQVGHLLSGDCLIVDALQHERQEALEAAQADALNSRGISRNDRTEADDIRVDGFDFGEHQLSDLLSGEEETDLDLTTNGDEPQSLEISLIDYSNKAIAEYLVSNEKEKSEDHIRSALEHEGFPKTRVTEILGIMKYLKVNSTLDGKLGIDRRSVVEEFKMPAS